MLKPCEAWNERISAYLDQECARRDCDAVERHLAACPACRAAAELYRCDAQDATAALTPRGASDHFAANVMHAVKTLPATRPEAQPLTNQDIDRAFAGEPLTPKRQPAFGWAGVLTSLFVLVVCASTLFPTFNKSREKSRSTQCTSNVRQLALAIQMYVQDHGGVYPPADNWAEAILDYVGSKDLFRCPLDEEAGGAWPISYTYNVNVAGKLETEIKNPSEVPVVWDNAPRHNGIIIGFADARAKLAPGVKNIKEYAEKAIADFAKADHGETPDLFVDGQKTPTIAPPDKNYGLADKLQIAYRASVSLESADVQRAMERAEALFRRYDGFVLTSDYQHADGASATATVSGRVPSGKLGEMLVEIDRLGTLTARSVNGEDLTAAHLQNLETLADLAGAQGNLERIGSSARKTNDALNVETKRSEAARSAGGARIDEYKLKSRVTLAEVTITIAATPKPQVKEPDRTVQATFRGSLKALGAFGKWLAVIGVALAPWLLIIGPILGLVLYTRRYLKKPRE